jgi:hypothetical protein
MMRRWIAAVVLPLSLTLGGTSHALAPGDLERGFREGANHHRGDDSFAALYGRLPGPGDGEALRMHAHFTHVRSWLGSRDATKPELAARRREILGYLDEYIAKGTTPTNAHVPWRTPVFIDDHGTICAVGYLIERTVGRPLAERIAHEHRYNLLEDIAAAMPEVRAWVESSGFTLEELASVQPGYIAPATWDARDVADGVAAWKPVDLPTEETSGTWRSAYPNGQRLAQGRFVHKRPTGTWRFFHPSGNLAARGNFVDGVRDGEWQFFHDAKEPIPKAVGSWSGGTLIEDWRHYDSSGKLVAVARPTSPTPFRGAGFLTTVLPGTDRVRQWVHQGFVAGTRHRLDYLADGTEQLFVNDTADIAYDAGGHKLARAEGGAWQSSDCHWNRVRRVSAQSGDVVTLHGLTFDQTERCDDPRPIPDARAKHIEAMLRSLHHAGIFGPPPAAVDWGTVVATEMAFVLGPLEVGTPAAGSAAVAAR